MAGDSFDDKFERAAGVVTARPGDNLEKLIRIFKKQIDKAGILNDYRKKAHYEKPSVRLKKKSIAARKRKARQERKLANE